MTAPIIAGVDGSAHAWRAVDWAADHAVRLRRPLVLLHGSRALAADGAIPPDALRRLTAERQAVLDEALRYALKLHPGLDVTTRLVPTDPGRALVAESDHAALIVVGSRGAGGFEGLLFGSVGLHTTAHARCPVLVVSRSSPYPADALPEIVVGLKGDRAETAVLTWAFEEAAARGAAVVALHAAGTEFGAHRVLEDLHLSEATAGLTERFPDVPVKHLVSDRTPARALTEASQHAGVVVVGAHAERGLGRVNHAVLHHAGSPVVVVPARRCSGGRYR